MSASLTIHLADRLEVGVLLKDYDVVMTIETDDGTLSTSGTIDGFTDGGNTVLLKKGTITHYIPVNLIREVHVS